MPTYVDEDMWNEAMSELATNIPGYIELCDCGSTNCDCD